jgi:Toxin SymE, type I toxin-antitoxin system
MEQRVRKMKISHNSYPTNGYRYTGYGGSRYTSVPFIRLQGQWLRKLGFEEGAPITVWPKKKKLIITLDKKYRAK